MQRLVRKLFRARRGEWGPVLLLQLLVFLIIGTLLIVKPTASALFLSQYGAVGLPYMFLATAVLAGLVSVGYAAALRRYSLLRVSLSSLFVCLIVLLGCAIFMRIPLARPTVAVVLYLWTALFGVLAASQFWLMASFVFDVRQAKRLFGLVGAGAIAGGIAGGYLTNLLAREIGARNLIFLAAGLLVPCILLTWVIWQRYVTKKRSLVARKKQTGAEAKAPHRLIVGDRFLLLLCAIVTLSVIAAKLVDYQFSVLAAERYGDQNRLAAFFGFWYSTFNIVALLIQLVLTQRVVQRLGVSSSLLFLPAGLGFGALVMLFVPGLSAATLSRSIDGSLKQSLSRAALELLFLPLDEETKKRVKTYIDVFIDSLAGGIGGLLLIAGTQLLGLSAPMISWLVLLVVTGWLACVVLIREEYIQAFRNQLSHLKPENLGGRPRTNQIIADFLRVLEEQEMSAHEKQLLFVLERTDDLSDEAFQEPVRRLLQHPSPGIRSRALRSLYLQPGTEMLEEVIPLLRDSELQVRSAAFDYLFSRPKVTAADLLANLLNDPDPEIAGPAMVSLATETAGNEHKRADWEVPQRLRNRIRQLPELELTVRKRWHTYLLRAAGRAGSSFGRSFIHRSLLDDDLDIAQAAILAAGESQHEDLILPLLHSITNPDLRAYAVNALVQYDAGLLAAIPEFIHREELSLAELRRLPAVLERIDNRRSVELLFALIERYEPNDSGLRLQVIKALNAIRRDFPQRALPNKVIYRLIVAEARLYENQQELLNAQNILLLVARSPQELNYREAYAALLRERLTNTFDRLLRLLGLRYPPADIIPVHRALKSEEATIQTSGIEFLDNLLELSLKRLIIPLLDQRQRRLNPRGNEILPVEENMEELRRKEFKSLRRALRGRDQRMKVAALQLMSSLGDAKYLPVLAHYANNPELPSNLRRVAKRSLTILEQGLANRAAAKES